MEQKYKQRQSSKTDEQHVDSDPAPVQTEVDDEEIDDLLEEIDLVLEENAEEFVSQYVQKGGE